MRGELLRSRQHRAVNRRTAKAGSGRLAVSIGAMHDGRTIAAPPTATNATANIRPRPAAEQRYPVQVYRSRRMASCVTSVR
eukprot:215839-Prymnesium_polylepis.1